MMASARTVAIVLWAGVVLAGCTAPEEPVPPAASVPGPHSTMASAHPGDRVVISVAVSAVLTTDSFLVYDVGLPEDGLLVLGDAPRGLRRPDLVRISGVVEQFHYDRFTGEYDLGNPTWYEDYDDRKVVLADRVTTLR